MYCNYCHNKTQTTPCAFCKVEALEKIKDRFFLHWSDCATHTTLHGKCNCPLKEINQAIDVLAAALAPHDAKQSQDAVEPSGTGGSGRLTQHGNGSLPCGTSERLVPAEQFANRLLLGVDDCQVVPRSATEMQQQMRWGSWVNFIRNIQNNALNSKTEWRDISTAPRLGRILLAAWDDAFDRYVVAYGHWYTVKKEWTYDGYEFGNPKNQPKYWHPLPAPPIPTNDEVKP